MLFKEITILNQNFEIEHDMYVGTKDDRIIYIGKEASVMDGSFVISIPIGFATAREIFAFAPLSATAFTISGIK